MSKIVLSFDDPSEIKDFLLSHENGIYTGKNVDGQKVVVFVQQDAGLIVKTLQNNWWIVHSYDEDGYLEDETFEKN